MPLNCLIVHSPVVNAGFPHRIFSSYNFCYYYYCGPLVLIFSSNWADPVSAILFRTEIPPNILNMAYDVMKKNVFKTYPAQRFYVANRGIESESKH